MYCSGTLPLRHYSWRLWTCWEMNRYPLQPLGGLGALRPANSSILEFTSPLEHHRHPQLGSLHQATSRLGRRRLLPRRVVVCSATLPQRFMEATRVASRLPILARARPSLEGETTQAVGGPSRRTIPFSKMTDNCTLHLNSIGLECPQRPSSKQLCTIGSPPCFCA